MTRAAKALGITQLDTVRADSVSHKWQLGHKLLLCSDGLSGSVSDQDMAQIISAPGSDQDRVDNLIEKALIEGARDNITVVLVSAPTSLVDDYDDDTAVPQAHDLNEFNRA